MTRSVIVVLAIIAVGLGLVDETPVTAQSTGTTEVTVAVPVPPQTYSIPAGAKPVSDGSSLMNALSTYSRTDVVLGDGTYSPPTATYFRNPNGDRLWAAHLGQAVLTGGVTCGGNYGHPGCEIHGLAFNISNPAYTQDGAAIYTWGPDGVGTKVYDTTVHGNYAIGSGIFFTQVRDAVVQRVAVSAVQKYGIALDDNAPNKDSPAEISQLTDLYVDGVHEPTPGSSNGTAEFGIWIGDPVGRTVDRIESEHAWMGGLWTGSSSRNTTFSDITVHTVDANGSWHGTGIYNEHRSQYDTFTNFDVGPYVADGQTCEWNYGVRDDEACIGVVYDHGSFTTTHVGAWFDQGTRASVVMNTRFDSQTCAAVVNYLEYPSDGNAFANNDFSDIAPNTTTIDTSHRCS